MWILLAALAAAQDLTHTKQPLLEGHFARLDDEQGPAQALWPRNDPNTYRVFQTAEGVVQRALVFERGRLSEERLYDVRGYRSVTVRWRNDVPVDAVVHMATPVPLTMEGFTAQPLGGATLWLPSAPTSAGAELTGGVLRSWTEAAADVSSQAWLDAQLAACGCALVERHADWLDGHPGVRLRLRTEGPRGAEEALLWAVARAEQVTVFSYTAPSGPDPDAALAPSRAVMSTLRWAVTAP